MSQISRREFLQWMSAASLIALLAGCQPIQPIKGANSMKADVKTETAVKAALDKVAEAYAKRDIDGLLAGFASAPDVIMYGTGADEKRIGREEIRVQAKRDWSQTEAAAFPYGSMSISAAGPVAWAAVDASFDVQAGGQALSFPARITFVLEQRGEQWLIVHAHFSVPAAQAEGESVPS
jgi:ketosteroid isomerase-like protein